MHLIKMLTHLEEINQNSLFSLLSSFPKEYVERAREGKEDSKLKMMMVLGQLSVAGHERTYPESVYLADSFCIVRYFCLIEHKYQQVPTVCQLCGNCEE